MSDKLPESEHPSSSASGASSARMSSEPGSRLLVDHGEHGSSKLLLGDGGDESVPASVHVHGDRSLEGILTLIELASSTSPLGDILTAMCAHLAAICSADVASVYLRETRPDGEWLVMRANVGFPEDSIGRVALRVGEGLTGFVAERLRPVSVRVAQEDAHYKHIPELGEEKVPVYVGVPLTRGTDCVGVLVLQRRSPDDFHPTQVPLLAALAAPFSFALDNAERRAATNRAQFARLPGIVLVPGAAMGQAALVPTLASLTQAKIATLAYSDEALRQAWNRLSYDMDLARAALAEQSSLDGAVSRALVQFSLILQDSRFRECVIDEWKKRGLVAGLRAVAQRYAKVPYQVPDGAGTPALAENARNMEDICVLLCAGALGQRFLPSNAVWIADHIGTPLALCAVARKAAAVAVASEVRPESDGVLLARAGRVPLISAVQSLFTVVSASDLVAVDSDEGAFLVNPPASMVAKIRSARSERPR